MGSVGNSIEREKKSVQAFFTEDVELEFYDMSRTYCTYKVTGVNGVKPAGTLLVSFYDDLVYISDRELRDGYAGKLTVFDKVSQYNALSYSRKFRTADCENPSYMNCPVVGEKVSFVEYLCNAYLRTWAGGRNDYPEDRGVLRAAKALGVVDLLDAGFAPETIEGFKVWFAELGHERETKELAASGKLADEKLMPAAEKTTTPDYSESDRLREAEPGAKRPFKVVEGSKCAPAHVVLETADRATLLFRGEGSAPFVIAFGYDESTGTWAKSLSFDKLSEASCYFESRCVAKDELLAELSALKATLREAFGAEAYENRGDEPVFISSEAAHALIRAVNICEEVPSAPVDFCRGKFLYREEHADSCFTAIDNVHGNFYIEEFPNAGSALLWLESPYFDAQEAIKAFNASKVREVGVSDRVDAKPSLSEALARGEAASGKTVPNLMPPAQCAPAKSKRGGCKS